MNFFDVAIVGGGASGSVLAIMLASGGKKVCIFDAQDFVSKKLLVTGNGRCNITNNNTKSAFFNQNIDVFLQKFDQNATKNFFNSLGVEIYADAEGRCYPVSNTAKSVVFALQNKLKKLGVTIFNNTTVADICFDTQYQIKSGNTTVFAKDVAVCSGACQSTFDMLKNFNIQTKAQNPSLVALKTKQSTKRLDGTKLSNVSVVAKCGNTTKQQFGEVLFKQNGLSGICIFNLSTIFARTGSFDGKIIIDIFPNFDEQKLCKVLQRNSKIFDSAIDMLLPLLNKEVALEVLRQAEVVQDNACKNLSVKALQKIAHTIKSLSFDVAGAYDNNQVVSGGVILSSLTKGLESKNHKGLHFAGEVCDVDAECGGYNLQWAFCSAYAVANNILGNNKI